MGKGALVVSCPTCGEPVSRKQKDDAPFFPFCSERCKLVDLGKWFEGEHRISDGEEGDAASERGDAE